MLLLLAFDSLDHWYNSILSLLLYIKIEEELFNKPLSGGSGGIAQAQPKNPIEFQFPDLDDCQCW